MQNTARAIIYESVTPDDRIQVGTVAGIQKPFRCVSEMHRHVFIVTIIQLPQNIKDFLSH